METMTEREVTLREALPYIGAFVGQTVVVKVGGSTLGSHDTTLKDVATLRALGVRPIVVHGGGAEISTWVKRSGHEPRFLNGLRVTDEPTMEIVMMVLGGKVNKQLVAELLREGCPAVGLSGLDGGILQARQKDAALGLVGEVETVDLKPILALTEAGFVPVVAPLALGPNGEPMNVNADTAAAEVAAAAKAAKLVFLTDVAGVKGADGELLSTLTAAEIAELIAEGTIHGGMIPKVEACLTGLRGAARSHIIDGRQPHALLREMYTERGIGTMITAETEPSAISHQLSGERGAADPVGRRVPQELTADD